MAIDKDIEYRTAVAVTYTRTGNTLHRRERHAIKNIANELEVTFDETTDYQGKSALKHLDRLTNERDSRQTSLNDYAASTQDDIDFLSEQITEIEALIP